MPEQASTDSSELMVSVASLQPSEHEGWITKQGGKIKTWKKRWAVLKDNRMWYFATKTDTEAKGFIEIEANTEIREDPAAAKKHQFLIDAHGFKGSRVFIIQTDSDSDMHGWVTALNAVVSRSKAPPSSSSSSGLGGGGMGGLVPMGGGGGSGLAPMGGGLAPMGGGLAPMGGGLAPMGGGLAPMGGGSSAAPVASSPERQKLATLKDTVPFLRGSVQLTGLWNMWMGSVPGKSVLAGKQKFEWTVSVSSCLDKMTWYVCGPQAACVEPFADFFFNVGAPGDEFQRMNRCGEKLGPARLGSWIRISDKEGMDAGWFFPCVGDINDMRTLGCDISNASMNMEEWLGSHSITQGTMLMRDVGFTSPRETEFRLACLTKDNTNHFVLAQDLRTVLNFDAFPPRITELFRTFPGNPPVEVSVVLSNCGAVRFGVRIMNPELSFCRELCDATPGSRWEELQQIMGALETKGPTAVEIQLLLKNFGYQVYREGFDLVFEYGGLEETAQ